MFSPSMKNNTHTHKIISDGYMYCEDNKMEQCNEDWRKQGMQGCFLTVETEKASLSKKYVR